MFDEIKNELATVLSREALSSILPYLPEGLQMELIARHTKAHTIDYKELRYEACKYLNARVTTVHEEQIKGFCQSLADDLKAHPELRDHYTRTYPNTMKHISRGII